MKVLIKHYLNRSIDNIVEIIDCIEYVEQWENITGFDEYYMISNFGRIKSLARNSKNSKNRFDMIMRQTINWCGYLEIRIKRPKDKYKMFRVNRLVAIHFLDNPELKPHVNHKSGIKLDNRSINLEWMTRSENDLHAHRVGLKNQVGDKNNGRKLCSDQVVEMRRLYDSGKYNCTELSKQFNMSISHTWLIVTRGIWKSVA